MSRQMTIFRGHCDRVGWCHAAWVCQIAATFSGVGDFSSRPRLVPQPQQHL